jgi:hypothetical protein
VVFFVFLEYHTVGTVPKSRKTKNTTVGTVLKSRKTKNTTVGTVPKSRKTKNTTVGTVPCFSRFGNCSDSVVFFVFLDLGTVLTVWYSLFF